MLHKKSSPILDTACQTIRIEAETLLALADSLDQTPDFETCVEALVRSKGRLVITGIGKSAVVAQKIAATLNSTGQPALFLHAADAIHGDLGMIQPADFVLCISKSGETPEIRVLVPLLKNFGNPLIAMTANRQSTLATQADFVLITPVAQEADPNNLAPTASTTAQMALGDALATALIAVRGFTAQDFAKFHPGGALGKQLYLRVRDLYPLHERPAVGPDAGLSEILHEISSRRLGATAVLDAQQNLLGIITDGDLRRMLARPALNLATLRATDVLSAHPKTIDPDALAVDALTVLRQHSITQLVVMDGDRYLGMVHLHDLVREGLL
ncbi:MAG TPA: KpsF/GutQ family sugar-phosphate isomerase [Saprospiraceae bacterium]|nr:KpsF/GutQ family sugar-phosphate isomerase [Saprospiraceae bacterium]HNL40509.1 KpsF/GutQ family sugar-phosphate isomerase [Saprospiraceae bacterium]HNM23982.1 KpsF/GutQ family sugar-phosphate isomerase [Saprospiraceae bacterium]